MSVEDYEDEGYTPITTRYRGGHTRNPLNPTFKVRVRRIVPPLGNIAHAISTCPRCGAHMAINEGMLYGQESIICMGKQVNGSICKGHYYLDTTQQKQLEFVGTAP
jgi:hypothetical protein